MLKYQKIAMDLEDYIEDNSLVRGDKLPILDDLMKEFEVSKSTITKALEILEVKGTIYQVRGSGIFVRGHRRKGYINLLSNQGFRQSLREFKVTSDLLELAVINPTKEAAHNLSIEMDEEVYYVKRLRKIQGQPLCVEESYFKKSVVAYLNEQIVSESIFKYLSEGLNLKIGFSDLFFHVGKLKKEEAEYLDLKENDPGLYKETIFHLANGEAFDFSKIIYNYEQSQFYIQANNYLP